MIYSNKVHTVKIKYRGKENNMLNVMKNGSSKLKEYGAKALILSSGFALNCQRMVCDGWDTLKNTSGVSENFDNIGEVYMHWAWAPGILGLLMWFLSKANDKKAAVGKGIAFGVIAGYVIFGIGGDNWSSLLQSVSDSFSS